MGDWVNRAFYSISSVQGDRFGAGIKCRTEIFFIFFTDPRSSP
jgi:hypothetical protein